MMAADTLRVDIRPERTSPPVSSVSARLTSDAFLQSVGDKNLLRAPAGYQRLVHPL